MESQTTNIRGQINEYADIQKLKQHNKKLEKTILDSYGNVCSTDKDSYRLMALEERVKYKSNILYEYNSNKKIISSKQYNINEYENIIKARFIPKKESLEKQLKYLKTQNIVENHKIIENERELNKQTSNDVYLKIMENIKNSKNQINFLEVKIMSIQKEINNNDYIVQNYKEKIETVSKEISKMQSVVNSNAKILHNLDKWDKEIISDPPKPQCCAKCEITQKRCRLEGKNRLGEIIENRSNYEYAWYCDIHKNICQDDNARQFWRNQGVHKYDQILNNDIIVKVMALTMGRLNTQHNNYNPKPTNKDKYDIRNSIIEIYNNQKQSQYIKIHNNQVINDLYGWNLYGLIVYALLASMVITNLRLKRQNSCYFDTECQGLEENLGGHLYALNLRMAISESIFPIYNNRDLDTGILTLHSWEIQSNNLSRLDNLINYLITNKGNIDKPSNINSQYMLWVLLESSKRYYEFMVLEREYKTATRNKNDIYSKDHYRNNLKYLATVLYVNYKVDNYYYSYQVNSEKIKYYKGTNNNNGADIIKSDNDFIKSELLKIRDSRDKDFYLPYIKTNIGNNRYYIGYNYYNYNNNDYNILQNNLQRMDNLIIQTENIINSIVS